MDNDELLALAVAAGWTYSEAMLYDEEGVEGYAWAGPGGRTATGGAVNGDWRHGPEVPHEVRLAVDPAYRDEVEKRAADRREFGEFLGGLLQN
jgi:hypothetical protein